MEEARFETQQAGTRRCTQPQHHSKKDLGSKSEMEKTIKAFVKVRNRECVTFVLCLCEKSDILKSIRSTVGQKSI